MKNFCRICLQKSKRLRSIYEPGEIGEKPPNEMLQLLTGIKLAQENSNDPVNLPQSICKSCTLSLNMAFQFRMKALTSQQIIESYCNHKLNKKEDEIPLQIKEEFLQEFEIHDSLQEEYMEEDYALEEDYVPEETLKLSNEIKVEDLDLKESLDEQDEEEIFEDEAYLMQEDDMENIKDANNDSPQLLSNSEKEIQFNAEKVIDVETLNESNSNITKACTPERIAKCESKVKNKNAKNTGHICDICGNIFPQRGRMMDHRRRHETELLYQCELCDMRFSLREKLRHHLFTHRGGKPYKCSFCSRSFFYESVRKKHEDIHRGARPYACDICNKAFAYSHSLKKHKLIHADIKLFHCKYCDKDFRLPHHMKQHIETKLHQAAVRNSYFYVVENLN